jgi:hypothetical protein
MEPQIMTSRVRCAAELVSFLVLVGASLQGPAPVASAAGEKEEAPPPFSKRFDFAPGQDLPIHETIAGAHFGTLRIDTEAWKSGGHHIWIRVHVHVPEDTHDQQVRTRVELADREWKVLAADEIEKEVEEGQAMALKLSAHLDDDPAALVATVLLQLNAWPD